MNRQHIIKWAALVGLLALTACAPSHYSVRVASRQVPQGGALRPGARMAVVGNPMARSQVLDAAIAAKIAYLLKERNFRLSSRSRARYLLSYEYRALYGVYGYGSGPRISIGFGSGYHHHRRYPHPPYGYSYGYDYPYYHDYYHHYRHALSIRVIDLNTNQVVWAGRAYFDSYQEDDRGLLDYLLVAVFEDFGSEVPPAAKVIAVDDPRVLVLRTVTP